MQNKMINIIKEEWQSNVIQIQTWQGKVLTIQWLQGKVQIIQKTKEKQKQNKIKNKRQKQKQNKRKKTYNQPMLNKQPSILWSVHYRRQGKVLFLFAWFILSFICYFS